MSVRDRTCTLANGETVRLLEANLWFTRLKSYQEEQDIEWDPVYHLRELCLGRELDPEVVRTLAREQFLSRDGSINPVLRAVVLSSVRGEGRLLHLDSPFTDAVDRHLAQFMDAQDFLQSYLTAEELKDLHALNPDVAMKPFLEAHRNKPLPPGLTGDHASRETRRRSADPDQPPTGPGGGSPRS